VNEDNFEYVLYLGKNNNLMLFFYRIKNENDLDPSQVRKFKNKCILIRNHFSPDTLYSKIEDCPVKYRRILNKLKEYLIIYSL